MTVSEKTLALHQTKNQRVNAWKQLIEIIRIEILLQLRSYGFWVLLAVVLLISLFFSWILAQRFPDDILKTGLTSTGQARDTLVFLMYISIPLHTLTSFLCSGTLTRDARRKTASLLWLRPVPSTLYTFGKGIACFLLLCCIGLINLGVSLLFSFAVIHYSLLLEVLLYPLLLYFGSLLLLVGITLFCTSLIRNPLLVALLVCGLALYLDIMATDTLREPFLLRIESAIYFPGLGFGQDAILMLYRVLVVWLVGLLFFVLVPLVRQWRSPIESVKSWQTLPFFLLTLLLGGSLLPLLFSYQQILPAFQRGKDIQPIPVTASTEAYTLNVSVDPASGHIKGNASFRLIPKASGAKKLFVDLNAGLKFQNITVDGQSVPFRMGWQRTQIELAQTPFASGKPVQMMLQYEGTAQLVREEYAYATGLFSHEYWGTSINTSFIGQHIALLQGKAGSWYPLPWTTQSLQQSFRPHIDVIRLQIPAGYQVTASPGKLTQRGAYQGLVAQPHASLPDAFAVAFKQPQQRRFIPEVTVQSMGSFEPERQEFYTVISKYLVGLKQWQPADHQPAHQIIVMVPFLQVPIMGDGVLFYPETYYQAFWGKLSQEALYHLIGEDIAEAWLLNMFQTKEPVQADGMPGLVGAFVLPGNELPRMLAPSVSVQLTGQILHTDFPQRAERTCEQLVKSKSGVVSSDSPEMLQYGLSKLDCNYLLVAFHLQDKIGEGQFIRFIQHFADAHFMQPANMRDFVAAVKQSLHVDMSADIGTYICQDKAKPLDCLLS